LAGSSSRLKKECGSVFVFIIILVPIFLMMTGMVVDIGRAFIIKEELNKACMIAAEEAAKCIDIDSAEEYGNNTLSNNYNEIINVFFYHNFPERDNCQINYLDHSVSGGTDNPRYIEVSCEAEVQCYFLKLVSIDSIKVHSMANGRLRRIK
jgi:hypothetical protein